MKLNGFVGKGSGKLGSSVFAISGGEQIVREYNPRVANPNTDAQVAQRAKMKLMSQLAAALAPALAFKKVKLASARNQFVGKNIGLCTFADDEAKVMLTKLQLTNGNVAFPSVGATFDENDKLVVSTDATIQEEIQKVVIVIVKQGANDTVSVTKMQTLDVPASRVLNETIDLGEGGSYVVYVYGWKPNAGSENVSYENYSANALADEASVSVIIKTLLQSGVFTETQANNAEL